MEGSSNSTPQRPHATDQENVENEATPIRFITTEAANGDTGLQNRLYKKLKDEEIDDAESILQLDNDDFKDMDIKTGPRTKLRKAAQAFTGLVRRNGSLPALQAGHGAASDSFAPAEDPGPAPSNNGGGRRGGLIGDVLGGLQTALRERKMLKKPAATLNKAIKFPAYYDKNIRKAGEPNFRQEAPDTIATNMMTFLLAEEGLSAEMSANTKLTYCRDLFTTLDTQTSDSTRHGRQRLPQTMNK